MHKKLKEVLDTMDKPPEAEAFCENLRDRAGVIADCGRNDYIFRHKSLREYLSARQIRNDYSHEQDRIERLARISATIGGKSLSAFLSMQRTSTF